MNSTKLASEDIVRIVEACSKSGVKTLTFGKLKVDFLESRPMVQEVTFPVSTPSDQSETNERVSKTQEAELRQEQLDHLMITDPVAYEKAIMDGGDDGEPSN